MEPAERARQGEVFAVRDGLVEPSGLVERGAARGAHAGDPVPPRDNVALGPARAPGVAGEVGLVRVVGAVEERPDAPDGRHGAGRRRRLRQPPRRVRRGADVDVEKDDDIARRLAQPPVPGRRPPPVLRLADDAGARLALHERVERGGRPVR